MSGERRCDRALNRPFSWADYGLAGEPEKVLARLRTCPEPAPTAFLALSCSKAFSLYRERVGALFVVAAAVARVLCSDILRASWLKELPAMRTRIASVRNELAEAGQGIPALAAVARQRGIFSLLPVDRAEVDRLAEEHAIYMPRSGRINVAGLKTGDAVRLVEALRKARH